MPPASCLLAASCLLPPAAFPPARGPPRRAPPLSAPPPSRAYPEHRYLRHSVLRVPMPLAFFLPCSPCTHIARALFLALPSSLHVSSITGHHQRGHREIFHFVVNPTFSPGLFSSRPPTFALHYSVCSCFPTLAVRRFVVSGG